MQGVKQFVDVGDGVQICYEITDFTPPWSREEPETFLLHHGYCRNKAFFRTWLPLLGRSFRVLGYDARGCGDSDKPMADVYSIENHAGDALKVMDALGLARVHFVGESSGGMVGLWLAQKHPERLHSLTLCNTPLKRRAEIGAAYTLGESDQASAIRKLGVGEWCRQTIGFRIDMNRATPEMAEWVAEQMDKTPPRVAIALHKDIGGQNLLANLAGLRMPTLILASSGSKVAGEQQVREMAALLPDARIVTFEGIGHGLNLLEPERCVEEILRFVAGR